MPPASGDSRVGRNENRPAPPVEGRLPAGYSRSDGATRDTTRRCYLRGPDGVSRLTPSGTWSTSNVLARWGSDKRSVLHEIHHWIATEMAKDIALIQSRYPELGDLYAVLLANVVSGDWPDGAPRFCWDNSRGDVCGHVEREHAADDQHPNTDVFWHTARGELHVKRAVDRG